MVLHEMNAFPVGPDHQAVAVAQGRRYILFIPPPAEPQGISEQFIHIGFIHFIIIGVGQRNRFGNFLPDPGFDGDQSLGTFRVNHDTGENFFPGLEDNARDFAVFTNEIGNRGGCAQLSPGPNRFFGLPFAEGFAIGIVSNAMTGKTAGARAGCRRFQ